MCKTQGKGDTSKQGQGLPAKVRTYSDLVMILPIFLQNVYFTPFSKIFIEGLLLFQKKKKQKQKKWKAVPRGNGGWKSSLPGKPGVCACWAPQIPALPSPCTSTSAAPLGSPHILTRTHKGFPIPGLGGTQKQQVGCDKYA